MKKWTVLLLCAVLAVAMLAGCQKTQPGSTADVKTADVWARIEADIGTDNMPGMSDGNADVLQVFYGIENPDELFDEYTLKYCEMNVRADEFLIAKVKDGKMDDVKAAVEKHKGDLVATWERYLPEVFEHVQDSRTETAGNYLLFVVSPEADKAVSAFQSMTSGADAS